MDELGQERREPLSNAPCDCVLKNEIPLNTLSKIHIGSKANKEWCEQTLEVILAKIKDYNCSFKIEISNLKIQ